jgi:hypothetical protein
LTYESLGTLRTAQGYWKKAKASYEQSRVIFGNLGDRQSVARVDLLLARLKEARDRELVRRRDKQRLKAVPARQLVLH